MLQNTQVKLFLDTFLLQIFFPAEKFCFLSCIQLAVNMAKILLHLQDQYNIQDFCLLRKRALVAITVRCPKPVAEYLTEQFYERNYNLRQRMDILEARILLSLLSLLLLDNKSKLSKNKTRLFLEV